METPAFTHVFLIVAIVLSSLLCGFCLRIRKKTEQTLERIQPQVEELRGFLAGNDYIRHSQKTRHIENTLAILPQAELPFGAKLFFPERHRKIAEHKAFLESADHRIRHANEMFVKDETERFNSFFDTVESQPLTDDQRKACVVNDDRNLVFAGAGTGKTSTIIGRTGYLLESKRCRPEEILLLAFGKKAAEEMRERQEKRLGRYLGEGMREKLPTVETFHALGYKIVGKVRGKKNDLSPMAENTSNLHDFIEDTIRDLSEKDENFCGEIVGYYGGERHPYKSPFDFQSMAEYKEYVCENRFVTFRGEAVKSYEELLIANFFTLHGVEYEYEAPYEIDTTSPDYRQYKPDFYLKDYGIYLEHFALDSEGNPPEHFGPAGRRKYIDAIRWKRELHRKHGTVLLETYSFLKRENRLEATLESLLKGKGAKLVYLSEKEKLLEVERLLGKLNKKLLKSELATLFGRMIPLFKESGREKEMLAGRDPEANAPSPVLKLLRIFLPVYEAYENELREKGHVDFSDMILQAADYIDSGAWISPYKHILIDEFQDINKSRMDLTMALIRQNPETILFAVGDDWQSIYRFTGSDLSYMRDFEQHYGPAAKTTLGKSFRFNNVIGELASSFIMKNSSQVKKEITTDKSVDHPAIFLYPGTDPSSESLKAVVRKIQDSAVSEVRKEKREVLVLGRYNASLKKLSAKKHWDKDCSRELEIECMTVHAAKGREADDVVVLDLGQKQFPSSKRTEPAIEFFLPEEENFPFAEERRLFYVALTRARDRVYLVYNPSNPSSFVLELLSERDPGKIHFPDEDGDESVESYPPCPECGSGVLLFRKGKYGEFIGCTNYPYCSYRGIKCSFCGGIIKRNGDAYSCINPSCGMEIPLCPKCGGAMRIVSAAHGKFWGCSNYRGKKEFSCRYTKKL